MVTMGKDDMDLWLCSWQKEEDFLFSKVSRPALEPTRPPAPCKPGPISYGGYEVRPGSKNDHTTITNAKVKDELIYTCSPPIWRAGIAQ